jgi:competence protein ComEA
MAAFHGGPILRDEDWALKAKQSKLAWVIGVCLLGVPSSYGQQPAASSHPELPDGPGKDTLIKTCSSCHSPDNVLANGQDRAGWEATLQKMAGFGAQASDEEFTQILEYLVKNFPANAPINVNKAIAAQLVSGLGLTAAEADAVVAYRKQNGDFKTMDDLKKVPGVDAKKLDAKKDRIAF